MCLNLPDVRIYPTSPLLYFIFHFQPINRNPSTSVLEVVDTEPPRSSHQSCLYARYEKLKDRHENTHFDVFIFLKFIL